MTKKLLLFFIISLLYFQQGLLAQEHYLEEDGSDRKSKKEVKNIKQWFGKGQVHGVFRYYGMSTINYGELSNHYANALGGRLYYESASLFGFSVGVGGNYVFNINSSDLVAKDPLSGRGARWERQLFDIENPENTKSMDRLEELFIAYHWKSSILRVGKGSVNTPLFNEQDGRMKPTMASGVWLELAEIKNTKINAGWIAKVAPRSTTEWYDVEDAIGIYSNGVNTQGDTSHYEGNLRSNGLWIVGITDTHVPNLKIQVWNTLIQNIQNSLFFQVDYQDKFWIGGLQYLRQDPVNYGGNPDPTLTYYEPSQSGNIVSGRVGIEKGHFEATLNGTKGFGTGRFTFPREFGTVRFYNFLPRLRSEGFGSFHSLSVKLKYFPLKDRSLSLAVDLGNMVAPDPNESKEFNKYDLVSWDQLNLDARYRFQGFLEGLSIRFFYIKTWAKNGLPAEPSQIHNRVNYHQFNLVAQISF